MVFVASHRQVVYEVGIGLLHVPKPGDDAGACALKALTVFGVPPGQALAGYVICISAAIARVPALS